ncbi:plasmid mobilization protein [Rhodoblastus sp.]|uniref:plasmid mobilization protein n=1 Tax=Rhodoblastus sp. TaxID=1962975 RepID=UPI003F98F27B
MATKKHGSEKRNLGPGLYVRFPAEERERLEAQAKKAGVTCAEFIRRRAAGRQVIARTDATLLRELRRLGGIAILALRTRGMADEGRKALADIRRAIDVLGNPPQ